MVAPIWHSPSHPCNTQAPPLRQSTELGGASNPSGLNCDHSGSICNAEPNVDAVSARDDYSVKSMSRSKRSSCISVKSSITGSHKSSVSSLALRQRAKAEAARVKLNFAAQEAEILKQQADLKAKLKILKSKKEVDEAGAKLNIFEESLNGDECIERPKDAHIQSTQRERTEAFVREQSLQTPVQNINADVVGKVLNPLAPVFQTDQSCGKCDVVGKVLNPLAPVFQTDQSCGKCEVLWDVTNVYSSLTKFIMKKELSLSRLSTFDDKAEFYNVWKDGFKETVKELDISPIKEIDLLIKHLGPESKKWAISIRTANASNPQCGKERIWERLDGRFASPEIIEMCLKKKLAEFPKLGVKDNKKLFELCDIVSEIEALKEVGHYQSLLSYYDTSSGVNPITCKLPYGLQEKWTTKAMAYKQTFSALSSIFFLYKIHQGSS